MDCPRCNQPLKEIDYEGVKVDTCLSCQGEWLNDNEMTAINKARDIVFASQMKASVPGAATPVAKKVLQLSSRLKCPVCKVDMVEHNYAYDTGVIVDTCPKCEGIWLDKDELEHVQILTEAWESRQPEIKEQFGAALQKIKDRAQERKQASIEETTSRMLPGVNAIVRAIMYKMF